MKRERYLRIYDLHSWSGICLGLFIYVVAFTGCLALFADEIKTWEAPQSRAYLPIELAPIMSNFENWVDTHSEDGSIQFITFRYPSTHEPYYWSIMSVEKGEGKEATSERFESYWNASTAEPMQERGGGLSEWLLDFHRDLMWPSFLGGRTVGRSLVGVAGVILLLSIISGIITHTKIIKQMFTLRVERSNLLKWQDLHKVMGLWPLPFHIMIAFTGAFLGIIAILSPLVAVLAFKGDTEALIQAVNGPEIEPAGIHAEMFSIDKVWNIPFDSSDNSQNSVRARTLIVDNWGDQNAKYAVLYPVDTELSNFDRLELNGVTGEVETRDAANSVTPAIRVTNAVTPLHYGTFGGIWLKLIYAILGLILTVMAATGLIIWIERRLHGKEGRSKPHLYTRISKFTIGVTLGLPLASAAIFVLDKLYSGEESNRILAIGTSYFLVWFACIAYAFIQTDGHRCIRHLFLLTALTIFCIPLVNYVMIGDDLIVGLAGQQSWAWVDISAFVVGCMMVIISFFLPSSRQLNPRERLSKAL